MEIRDRSRLATVVEKRNAFTSNIIIYMYAIYAIPALLLCRQTGRVAHDQNDGIPSQKHLADIAILVHGRAALAALATLGRLRPHLLDVLEEQIEMPVVSDGVVE